MWLPESMTMELKESFSSATNSKADYARILSGFSNNQGGAIIFGIRNSDRKILGLSDETFKNTDEERLSGYFDSIFQPAIIFEKHIIDLEDKTIGMLIAKPHPRKPVICKSTVSSIVSAGEIYYRYTGKTEKIKFPELTAIMDEVKRVATNQLLDTLSQLNKIGAENMSFLNTDTGAIHAPGGETRLFVDQSLLEKIRLVESGALRPDGETALRIIGNVEVSNRNASNKEFRPSNNPKAPEVQIAEEDMLKIYPFDHYGIIRALKGAVPGFVPNNEFNHQLQDLRNDKRYHYNRFNNPKQHKGGRHYYSKLALSKLVDYFKQRLTMVRPRPISHK